MIGFAAFKLHRHLLDSKSTRVNDGVTFEVRPNTTVRMAQWFWYAVAAAVLYGAHQIFTRLASDHIGDGLGGFVVEATAALTILLYLAALWFGGRWNQKFSNEGFYYSALTGICVGAGTIVFFLLFQRGGPVVFSASDPGRRRGNYGNCGNAIFPRAAILATTGGHHACDRGIVSSAQIASKE